MQQVSLAEVYVWRPPQKVFNPGIPGRVVITSRMRPWASRREEGGVAVARGDGG